MDAGQRFSRIARGIAVVLWWITWMLALVLMFTTHVAHLVIAGLCILSVVPYMVSIKRVEPWLERRYHSGGTAH